MLQKWTVVSPMADLASCFRVGRFHALAIGKKMAGLILKSEAFIKIKVGLDLHLTRLNGIHPHNGQFEFQRSWPVGIYLHSGQFELHPSLTDWFGLLGDWDLMLLPLASAVINIVALGPCGFGLDASAIILRRGVESQSYVNPGWSELSLALVVLLPQGADVYLVQVLGAAVCLAFYFASIDCPCGLLP
ncbi:hypothetical protein Nepgr_023163 [Nepenthes gracilis]|uniref:Uncharacterized protein n=1 Tax=Nepenthes gracilis TaxID=150966 RepID=A0AAD3T3T8_NEPGR|nr:hypothetical protein Nepgr_023163 [Nepenthes gracilis]